MSNGVTDWVIPNESEMMAFGGRLAQELPHGAVIFLQGELGAGKTTLVRGVLRGLGYEGHVKSPTFTLVESYALSKQKGVVLHHFDFYRLKDAAELEHLGLEDYFTRDAINLIEWPENAGDWLPAPTLCCKITILEKNSGRCVTLSSESQDIIERLLK